MGRSRGTELPGIASECAQVRDVPRFFRNAPEMVRIPLGSHVTYRIDTAFVE